MSFREVETNEDLSVFLEISGKGWAENNWQYETVERQDVKKFLVLGESKDAIGTFEIIPFKPEEGTAIDDVFPFSKHPEVISSFNNVLYELDKFSILKEDRGIDSIILIFEALIEVAAEYNIDKYLSLTRHSLFRLLHRFNIPINALGEMVYYESDKSKLIPSIIYVEGALKAV